MGGTVIAESPQRGPEESPRRSWYMCDICPAARFSVADIYTHAPESCVVSIMGRWRIHESCKGIPDDSRRRCGDVSIAACPLPQTVIPMLESYY
jgi:hypothetical protein